MNLNNILLRRRGKVVLERGRGQLLATHLATINKNLESLGYTLSSDVLSMLATLNPEEATRFYEETIGVLKEHRGVKDYRPMYPNFPQQVMEASRAELYVNAMLHYLSAWLSDVTGKVRRSNTVWLPSYVKEPRPALEGRIKLIVIDLGTEEEFHRIFSALIASNSSISETDKADLKWYAENYPLMLPDSIPNKEVLAFVGALVPHNPELKRHIKTATDVLRLAVAISGGDVSLAEYTRFRNFSRGERKALLALMENCAVLTEDMLRRKGRWIRLGERLHPGEYKEKYPRTAEAFNVLRNDVPFPTFNSQVENAIRRRDITGAVDLLRNRSGEFARRLDHLLRIAPASQVISEFGEIAPGVSTPVLLQTLIHFRHRNSPQGLRIFFPKGNLAKVASIPYNLPHILEQSCEAAIRICEGVLMDRFSRLPPLGKVYLDERLREYLVPFSQRSASRSLRTLVRGSRISFPETAGNTVRFFLWWREGEVDGRETGRVDIDLSAVLYDADWRYKEHISYTNLRTAKYQACHSGDITSAPEGACEFIDVDISSVLAYGGRYVMMSINSYTRQKFLHLPECRAGWMMRERPASGEVFEPAMVVDRIDVASDTTICIPAILDLSRRQVIWADLGLTRNPHRVNNVEGNSSQMTLIGKSMTELVKPDLYTLFLLHAQARGVRVEAEREADTVFSPEKGVTPFDLETITAEYLKS